MAIPEGFEHLSKPEQCAYFARLTRTELLDLLDSQADKLNALIDAWPEVILDGLDAKLAGDQESKRVADDVLARLSAR